MVLTAMIVVLYAWFAFKSSAEKPDIVRKYYIQFCNKLSRAGFVRKPDQGPVNYLKYVVKNRPDLKKK